MTFACFHIHTLAKKSTHNLRNYVHQQYHIVQLCISNQAIGGILTPAGHRVVPLSRRSVVHPTSRHQLSRMREDGQRYTLFNYWETKPCPQPATLLSLSLRQDSNSDEGPTMPRQMMKKGAIVRRLPKKRRRTFNYGGKLPV